MIAGHRDRRAGHASENSEYLGRLLNERLPEFLALLRAAERQVEFELSRECRDSESGERQHQTSVDDEHGGAVSP
jgi:hypothetical protein